MRRRLLALAGFASGIAAGTILYRRAGRRRERVDLYYDDGSMVSLTDGSPAAARLLPLGRAMLATARRPR